VAPVLIPVIVVIPVTVLIVVVEAIMIIVFVMITIAVAIAVQLVIYVGSRRDGQQQRVEINAAATQWKATGMANDSLSSCFFIYFLNWRAPIR